jgi:hypothetical protein
VPITYTDQKVANRCRDFEWEIAHAAVSRRPPISLDNIEARTRIYTYAANVGVCPLFNDHSLSPRAEP